jgi:hypothetical protein
VPPLEAPVPSSVVTLDASNVTERGPFEAVTFPSLAMLFVDDVV